jgi:hypothetical protein
MPANGELLRIGYRSPGSEIGRCGSEIADSRRRMSGIADKVSVYEIS